MCATIACQYTVGTSRRGDIVLRSRSPRKCHYPLFAYPLFKCALKRGQLKGATSKNVKNRQKVSELFSTLFDIFRVGQKRQQSQQVLNVGASTWGLETRRKAPLSCNAAFSKVQCSFSFVAAQLLVEMTSALQKSACCSATSAAQHSENCSATSVFRLWHVAGVGFSGVGFRTC